MAELTIPNRFRFVTGAVTDWGNPHMRDSFRTAPNFGAPLVGDVDRTLMMAAAGQAVVVPPVRLEQTLSINHDPHNPTDW